VAAMFVEYRGNRYGAPAVRNVIAAPLVLNALIFIEFYKHRRRSAAFAISGTHAKIVW